MDHHHHIYKKDNATSLNTLDVWLPNLPSANQNSGIWVIYIHGGAWRDSNIEADCFEPTVSLLTRSSSAPKILGYASINYRLSGSSNDPARNAKHPDHINDVSEALIFLESNYTISTGYLLVGHSCGATLAFQLQTSYQGTAIPAPLCVIGSEGIYDFAALIKSYQSIPFYREFITSAFGTSESDWKEASPASSSSRTAAWQKATVVIISQSPEDELVDQVQADLMLERIKRYWDEEKKGMPFFMPISATGRHDEVWKNGEGLAQVISKSLQVLHAQK